MPKAYVVIPTKNEEKTIESVVASVTKGFEKTKYDDVTIIVVDDSSDGTRLIAKQLGCIVVPGGGEGLGTAMYRGLKAAAAYDPDVIVAVDGDGQADAEDEIPKFLKPIEEARADMVLGSRFLQSGLIDYRYRLVNRTGVRILVWMLRRLTGLPVTDSHGGLRAMIPEVADELEMLGTHTYVQETIIDAVEKGYRVIEVPSVWKVRQDGQSRVVGSIPRYIFYTLPILLLRSGQHIRALYRIGLLMVMAAVLLFGVILIQENFDYAMLHRTPAFLLVALMVSVGFQFFFFGFVLQMLKQIKKTSDRVAFQIDRRERKHV